MDFADKRQKDKENKAGSRLLMTREGGFGAILVVFLAAYAFQQRSGSKAVPMAHEPTPTQTGEKWNNRNWDSEEGRRLLRSETLSAILKMHVEVPFPCLYSFDPTDWLLLSHNRLMNRNKSPQLVEDDL